MFLYKMDTRHILLSLFTAYTVISGVFCYTSCPKGWMANEGSCYLFGTQSVHFTEAEAFCRKNGGHLVEVSDEHEDRFIKDRLRDFKSRQWWLGLTDEESEGEWKWFNSDVITSYKGWYSGQPDEHGSEDCAIFTKEHDFRWFDVTCQYSATPVCEMSRSRCIDGAVTGSPIVTVTAA